MSRWSDLRSIVRTFGFHGRSKALLALPLLLLPALAFAQASPPGFGKSFGASVVAQNSTTPVYFSITNPNFDPDPPNNPGANITLTGISFTDALPAGMVVATPSQVTNDCGGTVTATAGSSSIAFSGGTLDPPPPVLAPAATAQGTCTISVMILVTATGTLVNTTGPISANESGAGSTASASIDVITPLDVQKQFSAASVALNASSTLTFTITDPANPALSGGQLNDTLPSGLVVANPPNASTTCNAASITAIAGDSSVSLYGFDFPAGNGDSCQFSVDVTGVVAGTQNNVADPLTFDNGTSTGMVSSNSAQASIDVVAPPSIAKAFSPATTPLNATSSLTFTLTNPAANAVSEAGVAFSDTLPSGLTVADATAAVCGGTVTTTNATSTISLTGGSIAVGAQCVFSVTVNAVAAGQYTNTTGPVSSTNGGAGNTASANLTVAAPPTIGKQFAATTIPLNGTTMLDFTITNPNAVPLTGLAFTDNLTSGLVVAAGTTTNSCGGTLTAVAGSSTISLAGGALPAGGNVAASCDVVVTVQGTTAGFKPNSVSVTSNEGGPGNTAISGVTVVPPPSISKAFGAAAIPLNGTTSLSFTITNQDPESSQSGVAVTDTLPAGLVVATPNGLSGACGAGTITAAAGGSSITLTGGTLAGGGTCTFTVNVTGTTGGAKNNISGNVSSTEGGSGGTASATLDVEGPPSIAKAFNPTAIAVNATSSLMFTITNPASNAIALTGVAFTDVLPSGLSVASATSSTCGGTLTTTAPSSIALSGASINALGQCQFAVTVTGAAAGQYTNTTGPVSSTNGGTGNSASANLTVDSSPTITKAFGNPQIWVGYTTTLSFTISNPNPTSALSGIGFIDTFPAGLIVATPNGLAGACGGGTITAAAGSGSVSLSGASLPASGTCTFSVKITATGSGSMVNVTGPISSTETGPGGTSNAAALSVVAAPTPTPTLKTWALLLLALGFAAIGLRRLKRAARR